VADMGKAPAEGGLLTFAVESGQFSARSHRRQRPLPFEYLYPFASTSTSVPDFIQPHYQRPSVAVAEALSLVVGPGLLRDAPRSR
jgi:hypothetical protein